MAVSACLEAELSDDRRVVLLDDRGWGGTTNRLPETISDIWMHHSLDDLRETARVVVGPDEPPDGRSHEDEEETHLAMLAQIAQRQRVAVDAAELEQLPHDVVPSARLLARSGHPSHRRTDRAWKRGVGTQADPPTYATG